MFVIFKHFSFAFFYFQCKVDVYSSAHFAMGFYVRMTSLSIKRVAKLWKEKVISVSDFWFNPC